MKRELIQSGKGPFTPHLLHRYAVFLILDSSVVALHDYCSPPKHSLDSHIYCITSPLFTTSCKRGDHEAVSKSCINTWLPVLWQSREKHHCPL